MIECLYGVCHSEGIEVGGLRVLDIPVRPSPELVEELNALPPGTSVGIEFHPQIREPRFNPYIAPELNYYWEFILRLIEGNKLRPIYLEDPDLVWQCIQETIEVERMKEELLELLAEKRLRFEEERTREEMFYSKQVELEYLLVVKREEKLIELMGAHSPQIVIIGGGHGDLMFSNNEELLRAGLVISDFRREDLPSLSTEELDIAFLSELVGIKPRMVYQTAKMVTDFVPDASLILKRELLLRRYRAVKEGRIILDGKPNYRGTWRETCRPEGLFEVYCFDPRIFSGLIEDSLGTAIFEGEISDHQVSFTKIYVPGKTIKSSDLEVKYQGKSDDGRHYEGFYSFEGVSEANRFFLSRVID